MKRLRLAVGFTVPLLLAVLAIAWFSSERKPYRGRTLSQWLQPTVMDRQSHDGERNCLSNSALAFEEAGRSGIELLLQETAAADNGWNWRVFAAGDHLYQRGWLAGTRPRVLQWPQERLHWPARILSSVRVSPEFIPLVAKHFSEAENALASLGKRAPSARVSNQTARHTLETRFRALAAALANGGRAGTGILTNALSHAADPERKSALAYALQLGGTNAEAAVPALLALAARPADLEQARRLAKRPVPPGVHPSDWPGDYSLALRALIAIRGQASIPFLVKAATNGHVGALSALGEYGPTAQACLPQLLPLTTNADPQVSFQAEIAVRKIRGGTELPANP